MSIRDLLDTPGADIVGDPRDWSKPSKAVLWSSDDRAVLLCTAGPHVAQMIDDGCSWDVEELGFEGDIPDGFSVWEGTIRGGERLYEGDYADTYLVGTYRKPTPAEMAAITAGRVPWHDDGWLTEAAREERRAISRERCGKGACILAPEHPGSHSAACGCLNGCKAAECPNV